MSTKDGGPALDLEAIRKRCEAATPGPWRWERATERYSEDLAKLVGPDYKPSNRWDAPGKICDFGNAEQYYPTAGIEPSEADAEFIAHARTDIPLLIAEVERLKAELASVTEPRDRRGHP